MSLLGDLFMLSPLFFFFACLIVAILSRIKPRKLGLAILQEPIGIKREQRLLTKYMGDVYPYLRHEKLEGWEDTDYSEAEGYESSAEMDLEDEE